MDVIYLSDRPTPEHTHRCLSQQCQGRQWRCTKPRCYQVPAQPSCGVCAPPPRLKPVRAPLVHYSPAGVA
jgi:hypothetical protein